MQGEHEQDRSGQQQQMGVNVLGEYRDYLERGCAHLKTL